jgi:hypothetical protein
MPENVYYVAGAYLVMWVVIIGYFLRLRSALRQSRAALEHAKSRGGRS